MRGGEECGMRCHITTVVCLDCKELQDVHSVSIDWRNYLHTFLEVALVCQVDAAHLIQEWRSGEPCPSEAVR
jgi:hypothetical protein